MDSIKINKIIEDLRGCLDEERFEHTLGVAEMCQLLADKFSVDREKAYLAGLLHDCAKCLSTDELLNLVFEKIYVHPKGAEKDFVITHFLQ